MRKGGHGDDILARAMNGPAHATSAAPWRTVAALGAAAAVVKLAVLAQFGNHPLLQPHGELDTAYYIALGRRVAAEGVLAPVGAFFVSPLYVYFLAAVFAAGAAARRRATDPDRARRRGGGPVVRHRAALVWGTGGSRRRRTRDSDRLFTFNEVLILQSALDPFLVSCALYALTRTHGGRRDPARSRPRATSLGFLSLNRPNALVFAVAACAGVAVSLWTLRRTDAGGRIGQPAPHGLAGAAVLVASLPSSSRVNAARNYAVSGRRRRDCVARGLNLYIGNHDRADGTYTPVPGITPSIAGQAGDSTRVAESSAGPPPLARGSLRRTSRGGRSTGSPAIRPTPLRLTVRKIGDPAQPRRCSTQLQLRLLRPRAVARSSGVLAVGPWLLLPLGLVGLFWPALRAAPPRVLGLGDVRSGVRSRRGPLLRHGSLPDAAVRAALRDRWRRARSGSSIWCARASSSALCSQPVPCGWPRWRRWSSRISVSTTGLAASRRARPCWLVEQGAVRRGAPIRRTDRARCIVIRASCGSASGRRFSMRGGTRMRSRSSERRACDRRPATRHPARARRSAA